jgi:hypothetical protein
MQDYRLVGGQGNDTFVLENNAGFYVISDFNKGWICYNIKAQVLGDWQ